MVQHAVTFDTLAFAKKIESSGMEAKYAESIAEAVRDVFEEDLKETIFTKEDGRVLKAELKQDIAELRVEFAKLKGEFAELKGEFAELKAEIPRLKSEIIMWVIGLLFAQTAIILSVVKFIH